jgi:hypothetical protein
MRTRLLVAPLLACSALLLGQAPNPGYTDTPMLPGVPYRVHDPARPAPRVVTPAAQPGGVPSDAVVLFDGRDLSQWKASRVPWTIENGYMEVAPSAGNLTSIQSFGDVQLHVEWAAPALVRNSSQDRGRRPWS